MIDLEAEFDRACGVTGRFEDLPLIDRILVTIWGLEAEVNNGGFDQYYYNGSGAQAFFAPDALEAIGATTMADLVRRANALFGPDGPSQNDEARNAQLMLLTASNEDIFDEFEGPFLDYPDDIAALLTFYIERERDYAESVARYELAHYSAGNPDHVARMESALAALRAAEPGTKDVRLDGALVGAELVYLPDCGIGSAGVFCTVPDYRVFRLGSYTGLCDFLWAHHKGFSLAERRDQRSNTFTIKSVQDRAQTLAALKHVFTARYVKWEIEPHLDNLPLVIEDADLYFGIRDLRVLETSNGCEFEVS